MPNNINEEGSKKPQPASPSPQKINPDTDTAPDETVGTDADTDTPIDREVVNDAVLRGEDKPGENKPPPENNEQEPEPPKMNTDKK